jgi:hypothetical protein
MVPRLSKKGRTAPLQEPHNLHLLVCIRPRLVGHGLLLLTGLRDGDTVLRLLVLGRNGQ